MRHRPHLSCRPDQYITINNLSREMGKCKDSARYCPLPKARVLEKLVSSAYLSSGKIKSPSRNKTG